MTSALWCWARLGEGEVGRIVIVIYANAHQDRGEHGARRCDGREHKTNPNSGVAAAAN